MERALGSYATGRGISVRVVVEVHDVAIAIVEIVISGQRREHHGTGQRALVLLACVAMRADPQMHLPFLRLQPTPLAPTGFIVVQFLGEPAIFPVLTLLVGYLLARRGDTLTVTVVVQPGSHTAQITAVRRP